MLLKPSNRIQMKETKYFINQCKPLVVMLGLIVFLAACGGKEKTNEDLKEAFKLHQEAVKIRQMTEEQLEKLIANSDSLFTATYKSDLDSIGQSLKAWDEQLVEVPGFEEEHDHSGHDHHHHDEGPELNPQQHLEVQQYLLKEIKAIADNINQINER